MFGLQSYLWDNNQAVVQWLLSQIDEIDGTILPDSLISNNIKSVRKDAVINQVKSTINVSMFYNDNNFCTKNKYNSIIYTSNCFDLKIGHT